MYLGTPQVLCCSDQSRIANFDHQSHTTYIITILKNIFLFNDQLQFEWWLKVKLNKIIILETQNSFDVELNNYHVQRVQV